MHPTPWDFTSSPCAQPQAHPTLHISFLTTLHGKIIWIYSKLYVSRMPSLCSNYVSDRNHTPLSGDFSQVCKLDNVSRSCNHQHEVAHNYLSGVTQPSPVEHNHWSSTQLLSGVTQSHNCVCDVSSFNGFDSVLPPQSPRMTDPGNPWPKGLVDMRRNNTHPSQLGWRFDNTPSLSLKYSYFTLDKGFVRMSIICSSVDM